MYTADTAVFQSSAKLTPPPKYVATETGGGDPFGQRKELVADGAGTGTDGGVSRGGGSWAQPPFIPAPGAVSPPPVATTSTEPGAVLTGGVTAPVAPGITPPPVAPTPPPLPGPAPPPVGLIVAPPWPLPAESSLGTGRGPSTSTRAGAPGGGAAGVGGEPAGVRGRTVLAPGGVIGGEPAAAHTAAPAMRRVNPVGGVIGEQPSGTGVAAGGRPVGVAGQRGTARRRDESDQRFDPDNPWTTEEGVPAVLQPRAEPTRHEPGAGVIGIDR
jgi:hypothetical protein